MMNFALIYRKTEKGLAAAQAPTSDLTPGMLRVLLKVDGKRTEAELELLAREGEFEQIMAGLLARGLIEAPGHTAPRAASTTRASAAATAVQTAVTAPATTATTTSPTDATAAASINGDHAAGWATQNLRDPPTAAPAAAPTQTHAEGASLDAIKRVAIRALYDRLGPYGEEPAARIQGSKTPDALRYAIQEAHRRVAFFKGEHVAQEYLQVINSHI
jgi:hypothetical protein